MSDSEVVEIFPREVEVSVASNPAGVALAVNGVSAPSPFASTVIAGGIATVAAPESTTIGGDSYAFESWSDGGARVHEVDTSDDLEVIASYALKPEEPDSGGGGGSVVTPPPPVQPPPPKRASVRLASRPPGIKLGLGTLRRPAPFTATLELGTHTFLAAPAKIRKGGRTYRFSRWMSGGRKLGTAPRRALTVSGAAAYLAVYAAARQRR